MVKDFTYLSMLPAGDWAKDHTATSQRYEVEGFNLPGQLNKISARDEVAS